MPHNTEKDLEQDAMAAPCNEHQIADSDELEATIESEQQTDGADNAEDVELVALRTELSKAKEKAEENWSLFLSAKAETDNIRKRSERDVSNAHKYALEKFIPELLSIKDSLELGTKAAKENAANTDTAASNQQLESFLQGSEMTINLFTDVLAKFGVSTIDPQGELFNPEFHQAMTMLPNAELPVNTIIEVVQKGYSLNDRLLRPAMVIVSKG